MRTYATILRVLAATLVIAVSMLIVMADQGEQREGWEFVPVRTTTK